jgi:hypothetical protein
VISNVKSARINILSNDTGDDEPEISINASRPLLAPLKAAEKYNDKPSGFHLNLSGSDCHINEDLWLWSYEEQAEIACIEHDAEGKQRMARA